MAQGIIPRALERMSLAQTYLEDGALATAAGLLEKVAADLRIWKATEDADLARASGDARCTSCGRPELECSNDPCAAVVADREA